MGIIEKFEDWFKRGNALKNQLWAEKTGAKSSYNIALVGIGEQGREAAIRLGILQKTLDFPAIRSIYLLSSQDQKFLETKINVISDQKIVDFKEKHRDNLDEIINEVDICVVTADAIPDGFSSKDRNDYLLGNLGMIKEMAPKFTKDYLGNVVIVTNPTDTLAYVFAQYAGMDPRRIIGLNHLDTKRFRQVISKNFMGILKTKLSPEEIEYVLANAYAIGAHQNPIHFLDGVRINGLPLEMVIPELSQLELQSGKFLDEYKIMGGRYVEEHPRTFSKEETAEATSDAVEAIMLRKDGEISGSVPYDMGGEMIYTGLPVDIRSDSQEGKKGAHFEVKKGFLDLLSENEKYHKLFLENVDGLKKIVKELRDDGLIKETPRVIPAKPLFLENVVQREEKLVFGAGGESKKVYAWDLMGNYRLSFDSILNNEEKFASAIKVFDYKGENYIAIGTSSGIIIRSLESPKFKSELMISDPDGYIGHIRAIEVVGDKIIGSNYHVEFPKDVRQYSTGKGLYEADLDTAMKKERVTLYNVFPGMPGPLTKLVIDGQESIVFPHNKELLKYVPIHGGTSQIYNHDEIITAISRDGRAIGDSRGNVVLFDVGFDHPRKMKANHTGTPITALEHIVEDGEHLFMGDSRSYFLHSQVSGDSFQEGLRVPASRVDPNAKGASSLIKPVNDIKYFKINGNGIVFIASGQEVSSIRLKDLIAGKKENFGLAWNKDKERSVFSLDFYQGVVEK